MKILFSIVGGLVFVSGLIWFLQGINILPGSYMTGNPQWAINGLIAIIVGGGLLFWVNRRK